MTLLFKAWLEFSAKTHNCEKFCLSSSRHFVDLGPTYSFSARLETYKGDLTLFNIQPCLQML